MKLPLKLLQACKMYYINRENVSKGIKWNQEKDLNKISNLCMTYKLSFTALAGHFWFGDRSNALEIDLKLQRV